MSNFQKISGIVGIVFVQCFGIFVKYYLDNPAWILFITLAVIWILVYLFRTVTKR